jgi:hypothetical protein
MKMEIGTRLMPLPLPLPKPRCRFRSKSAVKQQ